MIFIRHAKESPGLNCGMICRMLKRTLRLNLLRIRPSVRYIHRNVSGLVSIRRRPSWLGKFRELRISVFRGFTLPPPCRPHPHSRPHTTTYPSISSPPSSRCLPTSQGSESASSPTPVRSDPSAHTRAQNLHTTSFRNLFLQPAQEVTSKSSSFALKQSGNAQ
jgi:hypothetical protein